MSPRRLPLLLVATTMVLVALLPGAGTAFAGPGSASASLSDTAASGRTIHTVLTVPATGRNVVITPGAVTATLGGQLVPVTVAPVQQEQRTAMLVVDTSGSMGQKGISAARKAAGAYLHYAPHDVKVGLVTFSNTPHLLVAPTLDRRAVSRALPRLAAKGETALYDGLALGLRELGSTGSRSMILLSDGGDTSSRTSLSSALASIAHSDIRMEVVGFRTDESQNSVLDVGGPTRRGPAAAGGERHGPGQRFSGPQPVPRQVRRACRPPTI